MDPTGGSRRIRHPMTSYRNPIPRLPTISDRIPIEFSWIPIGICGIIKDILQDPIGSGSKILRPGILFSLTLAPNANQ